MVVLSYARFLDNPVQYIVGKMNQTDILNGIFDSSVTSHTLSFCRKKPLCIRTRAKSSIGISLKGVTLTPRL